MEATIDLRDLLRARQLGKFCLEESGSCLDCKKQSRKIAACEMCLSVIIGSAMGEARGMEPDSPGS